MTDKIKHLVNSKVLELEKYFTTDFEFLKMQFNRETSAPLYSIMTNISGALLVKSITYQVSKDQKYLDAINKEIDFILENISNSSNPNPTYCSGICGFYFLLDYLNRNSIIQIDEGILSDIDIYLEQQLTFFLGNKNLDILHGALGIGLYFIKRRKSIPVYSILTYLDNTKDEYNSTYIWPRFDGYRAKDNIYDLGLSHGAASILYFISKCYQADLFVDVAYRLIKGTSHFLLNNLNYHTKSFFPSSFLCSEFKDGIRNHTTSRLSWCYGDLGILHTLLITSEIINDNQIKDCTIELLKTTALRIGDSTMITDAGFCHGSAGVAYIYRNIYKMSNRISEFKVAEEFWIKKTIEFGNNQSLGGYIFLTDKGFKEQSELLHGLAGILIVLYEYLNEIDSSWNEIFFLS